MFAVVSVSTRKKSAGEWLRCRLDDWRGIATGEGYLNAAKVLRVDAGLYPRMPEKLVQVRMRRAAELIAREGIREVLFPEGFLYRELFTEYGLSPPVRDRLLCGNAGLIAEALLINPEKASVTLFAYRPTAYLDRAARYLGTRVRELSICLNAGGEGYQQTLRLETGMSCNATEKRALAADAFVVFQKPVYPVFDLPEDILRPILLLDGRVDPKGKNVVTDVEFTAPEHLRLPDGYDPQEVMAALYNAGVVEVGALKIKKLLVG